MMLGVSTSGAVDILLAVHDELRLANLRDAVSGVDLLEHEKRRLRVVFMLVVVGISA
jgi:hypothetical protein